MRDTDEDVERKRMRVLAVDEAYTGLKQHLIDRRRIVFVRDELRRSGGYGVVRRAQLYGSAYLPIWLAPRFQGPPQIVAVKQIRISAADNPSELKRAFTKELLVWSSLLTHPGIAKFLGFYADFDNAEAWLVSPWEPYGNITDFISRRELEVPEKLSLVYDTIDALTFLHQLNPPVCHGDVKSANVLVNANCRAVLCDFGLARLYEDSGFGRLETSTGFKGSIRWCSPELLDGSPRTPNSDIYAWAWLVWEIMTGEMPYHNTLADYVIIRKIFDSPRPQVDGEARLSDCLQLWDLMERCWAVGPMERPTSTMCRTTVMSLPRCPPNPTDAHRHSHSAELLENLGDLESWKGNYEEGLSCLEKALRLYEQDGNASGVASVLRKQAAASYRNSYHAKAYDFATSALEKCRCLGDHLAIADASFWVGSSLTAQDRIEEAMPFLQESLEVYQHHGHDIGIVQCLERMGEIHRRNLRHDEAVATLGEAVAIASRSGDRLGEAKSRLILGCTYWNQGEYEQGATTLTEVRDIAQRIGWEVGVCLALSRLGSLRRNQGDDAAAEELYRESIVAARRSGAASWILAQTLHNLGLCVHSQGRPEECAKFLEESTAAYRDIAYRGNEMAHTISVLGDVKKELGLRDDAVHWYDQTVLEYAKLKDKFKMSVFLVRKAMLLLEMERYDEAALNFEASMILDRELGDDGDVVWNRGKIGSIPRTAMKWESKWHPDPGNMDACGSCSTTHASSLLSDAQNVQRRIPRLATARLRLSIRPGSIVGSPSP